MSLSDSESDVLESNIPRAVSAESKLLNSIETYGSNSYYYAHSKSKEYSVPDDAIVVEGPGIITGGAPVKLQRDVEANVDVFRRKIEKYAWVDEGDKVKIYIDDSNIVPLISESDEAVSVDFRIKSLCVCIRQSSSVQFVLELDPLSDEIDAAKSFFKVTLGKRVTVTLKKGNKEKWSSLKKN